jgi:hypothetical protein
MRDQSVTLATRRAMFVAVAVAIAAGEGRVGFRRLASAILRTDELVQLCTHADIANTSLQDAVDEPGQRSFAVVFSSIESSLAVRGEHFGSAYHIASLPPWPLDGQVRSALMNRTAFPDMPEQNLTPLHVLLLLLVADSELAETLASRGLTQETVSEYIRGLG